MIDFDIFIIDFSKKSVYTPANTGSWTYLWKFVDDSFYDDLFFIWQYAYENVLFQEKEKAPFLEFDNSKVESCY